MSKAICTPRFKRRSAAHLGGFAFTAALAVAACGASDGGAAPTTVATSGPPTTSAVFALETCPDVPWLHGPAVAADALPQPPPQHVLERLIAIVDADPSGAGLYVGEHQEIVVSFSDSDAERDADLVAIGGTWPVIVRTVEFADDEILADSTPLNNALQAQGERGIGSASYSPVLNRAVVSLLDPSRAREILEPLVVPPVDRFCLDREPYTPITG